MLLRKPLVDPEYKTAKPFPHAVFDGFFDEKMLREVLNEWPWEQGMVYKEVNTSIKQHLNNPKAFGPVTKVVFDYLNSPAFVKELEGLTGIEGLISDPYLEGGGLHQIPKGGFLKMHADFNFHPLLNAVRKINLLIYLNEDWKPGYGGDLTLIGPPKEMDTLVTVPPIFNRAVVFNTDSTSWHGHPKPLTCPNNRFRRSLALYYYRVEKMPEDIHCTNYREGLEDVCEYKNVVKYPSTLGGKPKILSTQ